MSKTPSKRPANDARPARRSLVELTAEVGRAVDDGLRAHSASLTAADDAPRQDHAEGKPGRARKPKRAAAPLTAASPEAVKPPPAQSSAVLPSDSAAEMLVQIAKDYQSRVLDHFKAGLNSALDHAKDLAETKRAGEAAADARREDDGARAFDAAAAAFRTEALQLTQANLAATFDFVRQFASARTAAEVVELTGTQARKNCELMLKQADALKSLAQVVMKRDRG